MEKDGDPPSRGDGQGEDEESPGKKRAYETLETSDGEKEECNDADEIVTFFGGLCDEELHEVGQLFRGPPSFDFDNDPLPVFADPLNVARMPDPEPDPDTPDELQSQLIIKAYIERFRKASRLHWMSDGELFKLLRQGLGQQMLPKTEDSELETSVQPPPVMERGTKKRGKKRGPYKMNRKHSFTQTKSGDIAATSRSTWSNNSLSKRNAIPEFQERWVVVRDVPPDESQEDKQESERSERDSDDEATTAVNNHDATTGEES